MQNSSYGTDQHLTQRAHKGPILAAVLFLGMLPSSVTAAVFDMTWTGQFAGFTLEGQFAFDENAVPVDGIVRKDDFTDFDWSLFDAAGALVQSFEDNHLSDGFNANYDTQTGQLLQRGRWDGPTGLSLGAARGTGLNIWSIDFPQSSPNTFNPHLHLTDWQNEFAQFPVQFGPGVANPGDPRRHIDGAFFERTAAQVTGDPTAGNTFGDPIAVTPVPLPAGLPLLAAGLGMLAALRRRKR